MHRMFAKLDETNSQLYDPKGYQKVRGTDVFSYGYDYETALKHLRIVSNFGNEFLTASLREFYSSKSKDEKFTDLFQFLSLPLTLESRIKKTLQLDTADQYSRDEIAKHLDSVKRNVQYFVFRVINAAAALSKQDPAQATLCLNMTLELLCDPTFDKVQAYLNFATHEADGKFKPLHVKLGLSMLALGLVVAVGLCTLVFLEAVSLGTVTAAFLPFIPLLVGAIIASCGFELATLGQRHGLSQQMTNFVNAQSNYSFFQPPAAEDELAAELIKLQTPEKTSLEKVCDFTIRVMGGP